MREKSRRTWLEQKFWCVVDAAAAEAANSIWADVREWHKRLSVPFRLPGPIDRILQRADDDGPNMNRWKRWNKANGIRLNFTQESQLHHINLCLSHCVRLCVLSQDSWPHKLFPFSGEATSCLEYLNLHKTNAWRPKKNRLSTTHNSHKMVPLFRIAKFNWLKEFRAKLFRISKLNWCDRGSA